MQTDPTHGPPKLACVFPLEVGVPPARVQAL